MRDEIAICEPTPESAETCTGATFRLPGRASCEPVDDACETSTFPTGLDASRVIRYVRVGASGGDGSEAAPFATIAEALASTTEPLTIALAAGEYTTEAALPADLEIRGVCADTVVLTHDDATEPALRVMRGSRLAIEGVTMRTGDVALLSGGDLVVRAVSIEGAATAGIAMIGGSLEASRVSIRDTRTDADGRLGRGLSFESGTRARLDTIVIEGSHDNGIGAGRDVVIEGRAIAVRDTSPNGAGRFGSAIGLYERSSAMLREVAIERASEGGVIVDEGSELTLEDAVVRDVVSEASMANGRGVFVRASTARVRRTLIERASGAAISKLSPAGKAATEGNSSGSSAGRRNSLRGALTTAPLPSAWISKTVPGGLSRTMAPSRPLGKSTAPGAVTSTPSISMRMPTSRSVADSTADPRLASSFTFDSTGLGDRAGTTAAADCSAARRGSRGQRMFMVSCRREGDGAGRRPPSGTPDPGPGATTLPENTATKMPPRDARKPALHGSLCDLSER
jgi:hypothetical protein